MFMKSPTYVVSWECDFANMAVYRYPGVEEAKAALDKSVAFSNTNGYIITREEDLLFDGQTLLKVFNSLTGSGVNRFASRAEGVKRLYRVLPTVARPGPVEDTNMVDETLDNPTETVLEEADNAASAVAFDEAAVAKPKRIASKFPINSKIATLMKEQGYRVSAAEEGETLYVKEGSPPIVIAPWAHWTFQGANGPVAGKGAKALAAVME